MRKAVFLLFIILFLLVGTISAQDAIDTIYGLITTDGAIVRVGPDFAYDAIGSLPKNASVVIVGRSGDFVSRWDGRQWLKLDNGGWVYARLVRTSTPFNSIPPEGRLLPRDRNGRVPEGFDLSSELCTQWQGEFTQLGNFMAGDTEIVVTYPGLQGANVYSVIAIAPDGFRTAFDSETTTSTIKLDHLPNQGGIYTWRVAPYWTSSPYRYSWQQVCLLETGGQFEKPDTGFNRAGSIHEDDEEGG